MRTTIFLLATALAASCGNSVGYKAQGDSCVASSECGPGLVCDFGQTPPRCAGQATPRPDANPNAPDANPNAPDANPQAPDANVPPIDSATPIDAQPIDATPPIDAAVID